MRTRARNWRAPYQSILRPLILALFFCSGLSGLVYEVLWTRRLTLTFGHSVLAASTVVTAYMLGLAAGSLWAGRRADRATASRGTFLTTYAWLEIGIALWAGGSPWLLIGIDQLWFSLAASGWTSLWLWLAAFLAALAALTPPTFLMGATLPVLSRALVGESRQLGRSLSWLYGVNTLGACAGAGLAGWFLLPGLGLTTSLLITAGLNLGLGALAWLLGWAWPGQPASPPTLREEIAASSPTALAAPAMALAGLASMALQLGWMRAMAQLLGSSVYAFSTTLAVFLAGLGLGGALFSLLPSSRRPRSWHLGLTLALTGLAAAGSYLVIDWLPGLALQLHRMVRPDILGTVAPTAGLAGLVILPPTLLMGLALPLASALEAHRRDALGRGLSAVYSANTAGCIAGAALAGLVAIPFLGVQLTLKLAALAYLAAALLVWPRAWPALLPGLAVLILPAWNLALIANGPGVYSDFLARARSTNTLRPPAFYRDGLSSTVTVNVYGPNEQALRVNGKVDASLGLPDMQTMLLLGYIPAAYHVGLRKAVVIGLGSGFSLRALANLSALERLDCVELEPAVVEAGRYWAGYNGRVLEDPRLRMHLTDGRTFIQASREKYDLIASEPSNPWIAGVANLYTREFYLSCVQRLEPGGIMAQWVQLYGLSQQDLHSVLRTFFEVFPHGAVWQTSSGDLLLLGSLTPLPFDLARLEKLSAASPAIRRDLAAIQLYRPAMLLGHYLGERDPFYAAFRAAPRNTDDRPRLEFTAPFGLFRDNTPGNLLSLDLARTGQSPLPPGVDPSPERRIEAAHGQVNLNRVGDIQLLAPLKDVPGCSLVAARSAEREQDELTPRLYEQALQEQPDDPVTLWLSALYLLTRGNLADGAKLLARLEKSPPDGLEESVLVVRAQVLHRLGRLQEAEACLLRAIGLKTGYSTAWTWLGRIQAASNKPQAALESFEQALSLNAYDPDARAGKTLALMALKRFPEAITAARAMLELQSDNAEGWMYLSTALQASGDARGSEQARARARQLDPKIGRPDQLFEPPDKNQLPQR